jgi:hypothetical protein
MLTRFTEGVLVAKKDFNLPKHPEIDTKNLYVRPLSKTPLQLLEILGPYL